MNNKKINVTQPNLPDIAKFKKMLNDIWDRKWLTNKGPYNQEFEKALSNFLNVKYSVPIVNGTIALLIALKALNINGEVITTPFSFVATSHVLNFLNIKPVFCDIDTSLNIDPEKIEKLISDKTTAILPVHTYGNPCDIDSISKIAKKYNLKVIYDAAHAFNVNIDGNSILNYGDISVLSFHATKVFNTIEGGAIVCADDNIKEKIELLINFGIKDEETIVSCGINAKMNELQSAYGLLQLEIVDKEISKRKVISQMYKEEFNKIDGLICLNNDKNINHNYAYFPILIDKAKFGVNRDDINIELRKNNIYPRKYFYPLINQLDLYKDLFSASTDRLPVATRISEQILCLPIYGDLELSDVKRIINIILNMCK